MAKGMKSTIFQHETKGVSRTLGRNHQLNVTFSGDTAYAAPGIVNLPALPAGAELTAEQVALFRGYTDHEDGHHRYTDLSTASTITDPDLMAWTNALEDVRIEYLKGRDYPGAKRNLMAMNERVAQSYLDNPKVLEAFIGDAGRATAAAVTGAVLAGVGGEHCKTLLKKLPMKTRKQAAGYASRAMSDCHSTQDIIKLAEEIIGETRKPEPEPQPEPESKPSPEPGSKGEQDNPQDDDFRLEAGPSGSESDDENDDSDDTPEAGGGDGDAGTDTDTEAGEAGNISDLDRLTDEELVRRLDEAGLSDSGDDEDDAEPEIREGKPSGSPGSDGSVPMINPDDIIKDAIASEVKSLGSEVKDGGDYIIGYSGNDRIISKHSAESRERAWLVKAKEDRYSWASYLERTAGKSSVISRRLERMLASHEERKWQGGHESGRIDRRRLVAASQGKPNVFVRRGENKDISTAVCLLVDLSGSMGSGVKSPKCIAQDVSVLMAQAMERAGAAVEVLGFSNNANEHYERSAFSAAIELSKTMPCRFTPNALFVFKDYETPVSRAHNELMAINQSGGGDNADGEFVEMATHRILKRPERRKILLVMSDGMPACGGSGLHQALQVHLKKAVASAERAGVETVGVGICSAAVRNFYPKWVVCRDLNHFTQTAFNELALVLSGKRVDLARTA